MGIASFQLCEDKQVNVLFIILLVWFESCINVKIRDAISVLSGLCTVFHLIESSGQS